MSDQLYRACEQGDTKKVRKLLARKTQSVIDRANRQKGGMMPLHVAARDGKVECVRMLLGPGELLGASWL